MNKTVVRYNPILASNPFIPVKEQHNVQELWTKSLPNFQPPDGLENYFGESQRHYHNMFHISRLLQENENTSLTMRLSIWFHDIIYDPQSKENEVKSAEIFEQFWGDKDPQIKKDVIFIILATIKHQPPEGQQPECLQEFLDLDLSVLGWPTEEYSDYAQRVRFEYHHVPDKEFLSGRIKVLEHLKGLNESKIFFTERYQQKYTLQAQINLSQEIELLKEF